MNKEEPKKEVVVSPKGSKVDLTKEAELKVEPEVKKEEVIPVNLANMKLVLMKELVDKLVRMERMLEWLIVQRVTDDQKLIKQPNIADIFREIASRMQDEKKEKKDEVPTDT